MAAGAFHEPLDLQRRSLDPLEDRGRCACCRYRGRGPWHHRTRAELGRRPHPDRTRHEGRQAGHHHQREHLARSLRRHEFFEFTRLFTSPPKSPRGYVDDPNPKSTTESARPPRALSHVWDDVSVACRRGNNYTVRTHPSKIKRLGNGFPIAFRSEEHTSE